MLVQVSIDTAASTVKYSAEMKEIHSQTYKAAQTVYVQGRREDLRRLQGIWRPSQTHRVPLPVNEVSPRFPFHTTHTDASPSGCGLGAWLESSCE